MTLLMNCEHWNGNQTIVNLFCIPQEMISQWKKKRAKRKKRKILKGKKKRRTEILMFIFISFLKEAKEAKEKSSTKDWRCCGRKISFDYLLSCCLLKKNERFPNFLPLIPLLLPLFFLFFFPHFFFLHFF